MSYRYFPDAFKAACKELITQEAVTIISTPDYAIIPGADALNPNCVCTLDRHCYGLPSWAHDTWRYSVHMSFVEYYPKDKPWDTKNDNPPTPLLENPPVSPMSTQNNS